MNPIVIIMTLVVFASIGVTAANAQPIYEGEADLKAVRNATRYLNDIGDFANGCSSEDVTKEPAKTECMTVLKAFNEKMGELWATHEKTIDKYRYDEPASVLDYLQ